MIMMNMMIMMIMMIMVICEGESTGGNGCGWGRLDRANSPGRRWQETCSSFGTGPRLVALRDVDVHLGKKTLLSSEIDLAGKRHLDRLTLLEGKVQLGFGAHIFL